MCFFRTNAEAVNDESKPDYLISILADSYVACNIGFDELKSESKARNHRNVNFDLVRLAIFAKNPINNDDLASIV